MIDLIKYALLGMLMVVLMAITFKKDTIPTIGRAIAWISVAIAFVMICNTFKGLTIPFLYEFGSLSVVVLWILSWKFGVWLRHRI